MLAGLKERHPFIELIFDTGGLRREVPFVVDRVWADPPPADGVRRTNLPESLSRSWSYRQAWFRAGPALVAGSAAGVALMKLFIVILCYRVPDLTIDCLRSLSREIGRVPGAKVGVCENGTGGDAADRLSRAIEENGWGSWVDLTVVYPNLGFTGGNNLVISRGSRVGRSPRVCAAPECRHDRPWNTRWIRSWSSWTAIPR